jgi:hypothetical protein
MAHLLDALLADMEQPRSPAARLCDLLALQAHEHMDFAEAQQESLQMRMDFSQAERAPRPVAQSTVTGENVVPFPARRP